MDALLISGGEPLRGTATVSGAKNSALPILAASILASEPIVLHRVPELADIETMSLLLGMLGVEVTSLGGERLGIETVDRESTVAPGYLVRRMRASFCVLGPLLARRCRAIVPLPGGCRIGRRPVDMHLRGLQALGADLRIERNTVIGRARKLRGATIDMTGPNGTTVTGTAQVMMAATLAQGTTRILGAAMEPEIGDLACFLNTLGGRISCPEWGTWQIEGVPQLGGGEHVIIPDRIEAATLLLAGAITGGRVSIAGANQHHLDAVLRMLGESGCDLTLQSDEISLAGPARLRGFQFVAQPFPHLPTDVQAQFMALACLAQGTSRIEDKVFPRRFRHVRELRQMGARIQRFQLGATIRGVARLHGAEVTACDLRASAALVLAGLAANGETRLAGADHLDRGYERLEVKLRRLGAEIQRVPCDVAEVARLQPEHPITR